MKQNIASHKKPDCTTHRVAKISDPNRQFDTLIHVCGKEVITELENEKIKQYEIQREGYQQPKETWQEPLARADLDAQETMASYTGQILLASVLGLGISAIGIGLLISNLASTKQAVRAAFDSNRAFVMAKSIEVGKVETDPVSGSLQSIEVKICFENFGNSPAFNVEYTTIVLAEREHPDDFAESALNTLNITISRVNRHPDYPPGHKEQCNLTIPHNVIRTNFPGRFLVMNGSPVSNRQAVFVFYRISYLDIQKVRRKTDGCFRAVGVLNPVSGEISAFPMTQIRPEINITDERGYDYKD